MSTIYPYTYRQKLADVVFPKNRAGFAVVLGRIFDNCIKATGNSFVHFCATHNLSHSDIRIILEGVRPRRDLCWLLEPYEVTVYMAHRIATALKTPLSEIVAEAAATIPCLQPFIDPVPEDPNQVAPKDTTPKGSDLLLVRRQEKRSKATQYNQYVKSVINQELKLQRMSRKELARLSCVTNPAIYKLLADYGPDDTLGNLATFVAIADVLEMSVGELFTRADKMMADSKS